MQFHEIANVWPLMEEDKLDELANDIRVNGLVNPIWTYEGKILDGRNRYKACLIAGVKPTIKEYTGDCPTAFAVSLNDKRRHLPKAARAAIGVELLPYFEADAKKRHRANGGDKKSEQAKSAVEKIPQAISPPTANDSGSANAKTAVPRAREEAAKSVGVNDRYIQDAKKVKQKAPEVFEKLKAGKITMQDAKREVAKKPTDDWRPDERKRQKEVESGVCVVANQNADKNLILWAERNGKAVRIDRSSKYGNPFILNQDGDRDEVCDAFEKHYLPHKPSIKQDYAKLKGKVLICHCHPLRCHGDCLAAKANGVKQ
jgi:ParB-like chromosome segregation protein Spo0J